MATKRRNKSNSEELQKSSNEGDQIDTRKDEQSSKKGSKKFKEKLVLFNKLINILKP